MYGVTKGVYERIDVVLWWFSHVKRMKNDRIAKGVYWGVFVQVIIQLVCCGRN